MLAFFYFLLVNIFIFIVVPFFFSFTVGEILDGIKKFKLERRYSKNKNLE